MHTVRVVEELGDGRVDVDVARRAGRRHVVRAVHGPVVPERVVEVLVGRVPVGRVCVWYSAVFVWVRSWYALTLLPLERRSVTHVPFVPVNGCTVRVAPVTSGCAAVKTVPCGPEST